MHKSLHKAHPWHGVDPRCQPPDLVDCIIEISRGSRTKYEVDKISGLLRLDRVLFSSFHYPVNYGFVPKTLADDHDPLDILVLSLADILPLSLVTARIIGVMRMEDNGLPDDKLLAVAVGDPSVSHIRSLKELPDHWLREVQNFFEEYKKLENKKTLVEGFLQAEDAWAILQRSFVSYEKHFASVEKGT
ncbi:MAG: inorganic diphosphatase [Flavobacteriales bacterium]|nr:inorganic diphosphatase [Flavobacteriales bacterium]